MDPVTDGAGRWAVARLRRWVNRFRIGGLMLGALTAIAGAASFTASQPTLLDRALSGLIGFSLAVLILIGPAFLWFLLRAPYEQRDEVRTQATSLVARSDEYDRAQAEHARTQAELVEVTVQRNSALLELAKRPSVILRITSTLPSGLGAEDLALLQLWVSALNRGEETILHSWRLTVEIGGHVVTGTHLPGRAPIGPPTTLPDLSGLVGATPFRGQRDGLLQFSLGELKRPELNAGMRQARLHLSATDGNDVEWSTQLDAAATDLPITTVPLANRAARRAGKRPRPR